MKTLTLLGCIACCGVGLAQGVSANRLDRIWKAAEARAGWQGDEWFESGDFPRVVQLLRLRAELFPSDYEIHSDLGFMLGNVERYDEELAVYVRFRQQNPNDPNAPFPEAYFWYTRKAYAKVPPLLNPTLARNPHSNSYRILAHSYEKMGLLADSKRVWDKYLANHEDAAAVLNRDRVIKKMQGSGNPKR